MLYSCTMLWTQSRIRWAEMGILPLPVIGTILLWDFWVIQHVGNQRELLKLKGPHCSSHLLFIFDPTFLHPLRQTGQTKAQEMGGTDQDSHWAPMIKGTLTQADTQVVRQFSSLVAHIRRKVLFSLGVVSICPERTLQHTRYSQIWCFQ